MLTACIVRNSCYLKSFVLQDLISGGKLFLRTATISFVLDIFHVLELRYVHEQEITFISSAILLY
jgi:hypothetical protein